MNKKAVFFSLSSQGGIKLALIIFIMKIAEGMMAS